MMRLFGITGMVMDPAADVFRQMGKLVAGAAAGTGGATAFRRGGQTNKSIHCHRIDSQPLTFQYLLQAPCLSTFQLLSSCIH